MHRNRRCNMQRNDDQTGCVWIADLRNNRSVGQLGSFRYAFRYDHLSIQISKLGNFIIIMYLPFTVGRHIGRIVSLKGTLSLSRSSAMSLSKLRKLKSPVNTLTTYLVSVPLSTHLSCSPNVTLIMNHMNLKIKLEGLIKSGDGVIRKKLLS